MNPFLTCSPLPHPLHRNAIRSPHRQSHRRWIWAIYAALKPSAHVGDPAGAQDVERERAQPGEDARPAPDAAGVLAQDAVADVVVAVLDAPVRPDRPPEGRRVQPGLAGVEGDLLGPDPQPGAGVLAPGQARDPRRAGDPRPPVRVEAAVHLEHLDAPVLLAAVPAAVDRLEPVGGLPLGAEGGQ